MSTLRVTAEPLTIKTHPNADALELAFVGDASTGLGYNAVVGKGAYTTGEHAIYIPEGAVLPPDLIEELGLTGKLAGKERNRTKAIRLRGELSQGIVCRPSALAELDLGAAAAAGEEFSELLGIVKWVPDIPVHMNGQLEPAPELLPWVDIENLRRFPNVFEIGESVRASEKAHGTCALSTWIAAEERLYVSSKGYGKSKTAIMRSDSNLYWRAIGQHKVEEAARTIAEKLGAARVGIFGEVFGEGVQDLHYGVSAKKGDIGYAVFDISIERGHGIEWLAQAEVETLCELTSLRMVPTLYEGPFDPAVLLPLAEGREQLSGAESCIREGVVVRPVQERHSTELGGRAIVKIVGEGYLTRKGGTEYE